MIIYTLTGKSGTGKSYHAMEIAKENQIDGIIDDGLFIYHNMVMEGVSAKKSQTKIGAVRTALFEKDDIRNKVIESIKSANPKSLLILGTSDEMTDIIMEKLELNVDEVRRLYITDLTTEEDREIAHEQREKLGKHAIPAPSLQLKRNFAGYFLDTLRRGKGRAAQERTVVRPSFSYLGNYIINERAINDIIHIVVRDTPGISKVVYISYLDSSPEQYSVQIAVKLRHGYPAWESAMLFQKSVQNMIESMTAFNVLKVDIEIRGVN